MYEDYVLNVGAKCISFWSEYLGTGRRILYILGHGFDPRMCYGIEALVARRASSTIDCYLVQYPEGDDSASARHKELAAANLTRLEKTMVSAGGKLATKLLRMFSSEPDRRAIGGVSAATIFPNVKSLGEHTDVVLDISALPRGLVFPMLSKLLDLTFVGGPNLHVMVAEDVAVDTNIRDEGIAEDAEYVTGYGALVEMQSARELPKVWLPVLGENQLPQIKKIRQLIAPVDEVCPVIPFPTRDVRRGDDLFVGEYLEFFFTEFRIDPSNVLYVQERNPFQASRQLRQAVERFGKTFESLGGCRVILSALSSKLLALGTILAAWDLKRNDFLVGVAHVATRGYTIDNPFVTPSAELFHLWLTGECYANRQE